MVNSDPDFGEIFRNGGTNKNSLNLLRKTETDKIVYQNNNAHADRATKYSAQNTNLSSTLKNF